MKKTMILALAACSMMFSSCGTMGLNTTGQTGAQQGTTSTGNILGDILGAAANGETLGNVLGSVLGTTTMTKTNLVGTWTYSQPGVAFTSDNLLAQAGGEVAASTIRQKVAPMYQSIGVKSGNTQIQFKEDGTFTGAFAGKQLSGNYTFDEKTQKITMQTLLFNINCYAKRNTSGIGLLFESSKLLSLLQTLSAVTGNNTVKTVGDVAKSYDGLRLGFDFK